MSEEWLYEKREFMVLLMSIMLYFELIGCEKVVLYWFSLVRIVWRRVVGLGLVSEGVL